MVIVMYPALVVMQWIARLVGGQSAQPTVSRAEPAVLADVSHTGGRPRRKRKSRAQKPAQAQRAVGL
ncbi:MAG: hypothetical protein HND48_13910 [Chloroflexi bacterium]|nr:hypothetical protein [Chloroflexota bacterium]